MFWEMVTEPAAKDSGTCPVNISPVFLASHASSTLTELTSLQDAAVVSKLLGTLSHLSKKCTCVFSCVHRQTLLQTFTVAFITFTEQILYAPLLRSCQSLKHRDHRKPYIASWALGSDYLGPNTSSFANYVVLSKLFTFFNFSFPHPLNGDKYNIYFIK